MELFLKEILADGETSAVEIYTLAEQEGIKQKTLRKAKDKLEVAVIKRKINGIGIYSEVRKVARFPFIKEWSSCHLAFIRSGELWEMIYKSARNFSMHCIDIMYADRGKKNFLLKSNWQKRWRGI